MNRIARGAYFPGTQKRDLDAARALCEKIVNFAVNSGLLQQAPCEICGASRTEAHHVDYGFPLKVHWLCRQHHKEWHRHHLAIRSRAPLVPSGMRVNSKPAADLGLAKELVIDVTNQISALCQTNAFDQSELARRMGTSRQYVSTLFAGGFRTLKMIVGVADYLGYDVRVSFERRPVVAPVESDLIEQAEA